MRKGIAIVAVVVLAVAAEAAAGLFGGSSGRKSAEKLMEIFRMPESVDAAVDYVISAESQGNPDFKLQERVFRAFAAKYVSWEALKDEIVGLYLKEFDADELEALVRFYETPAGRKSIARMPALMAQTSDLVQNAFARHEGELQEMLKADGRKIIDEDVRAFEKGR